MVELKAFIFCKFVDFPFKKPFPKFHLARVQGCRIFARYWVTVLNGVFIIVACTAFRLLCLPLEVAKLIKKQFTNIKKR